MNPPRTVSETTGYEFWEDTPRRSPWFPLLFFFVTVLTTTLAGADLMHLFRADAAYTLDPDRYQALLQHPWTWIDGWVFSVPLLLILGAHELGHFAACEYYRVDATFPYFIPAPTPIGTMGAFIRIRAPIYIRGRYSISRLPDRWRDSESCCRFC